MHSIDLYLPSAIASALVFYKLVDWYLSNHISQDQKESITLFLWGDYDGTWIHNFRESFFVPIFGKKHFTWRCFLASSFFSLAFVAVLYLFFAHIVGISHRAPDRLSLTQAILLGAAINIIPDYLSLWETRWILRRFEKVSSVIGQIGVLLFDAILTGLIIWLSITVFHWMVGRSPLSLVELLAAFSIFSLFFYSTFLTSIWAWLYCLSTWIVRLFKKKPLSRLPIEDKPGAQIALVCGCLLFAVLLVLQPLFQPEDEELHSRFDEALCRFAPAEVCWHLGAMALSGDDPKKAVIYFVRGCDGGDDAACWEALQDFYDVDDSTALKVTSLLCDKGDLTGCSALAFMYQKGKGVDKNVEKAVEINRRVCNSDHSGLVSGRACFRLGASYFTGEGVELDDAEAVRFFRKSCVVGDDYGCSGLGVAYWLGRGVEQDLAEAVKLQRESCDAGALYGCRILGVHYLRGDGVEQDFERAFKLLQDACDQNDLFACAVLGEFYENGLGVEQNYAKAEALYQDACDRGETSGCVRLGGLYFVGAGVEMDTALAVEHYQQACDSSDFLGCSRLGIAYELGKGVPMDEAKAIEYFKWACDKRESDGCTNLGRIKIKRGRYHEAALILDQACAWGDTEACYFVGHLYDSGLGGFAKSADKAVSFYEKACLAGMEPELCGDLSLACIGSGLRGACNYRQRLIERRREQPNDRSEPAIDTGRKSIDEYQP